MSNKGFLNENELSEQIHKYFDLKLDRDALLKPTKDVVRDIYKRFLDQTVKNWMKPKQPGREPPASIKMLYWMRAITRPFNTGFEFNIYDLTVPTRKRTTTFLNVILYVRAVYNECLEIQQQCETRRAELREKNAMISREVSKVRVELDELAFKIGQSVGLEQLRDALEEDDRLLRAKKKECDELALEKSKFKERIAKKEEMEVRQRIEIDEINEKINEYNRRKDLVSKISDVRAKLNITEAALQQIRLDNEFRRAEEEHELKMIEDEEKEFVHRIIEEMKNLQIEIKAIEEERQELKKRTDEGIKLTDDTRQMFHKVLDDFKQRATGFRKDTQREIRSVLQNYQVQLNSLLGIHDEPAQKDVSKNRTFIKSRND